MRADDEEEKKQKKKPRSQRDNASVCVERVRELIVGAAVGDPLRGVAATRDQLGVSPAVLTRTSPKGSRVTRLMLAQFAVISIKF